MGYLQPAEYLAFGLSADTADAWVSTASAMMEAHCRRPSLLTTSYTERFTLRRGSQSLRLSYGPLQGVSAMRGRYAKCGVHGGLEELAGIATVFGLPGQWTTVDVSTLDVNLPTGEVCFATGLFGLAFAEVEVTYSAGLATVPDAVKVACAQIVRNAQATPGLNVRSSKVDTLQAQYFSDSLVDSQVCALLRPYRAERLG